MTIRCACFVPYCRRTTGKFNPATTEWICDAHWRAVPKTLKARYALAKRRVRGWRVHGDAARWDSIRDDLWRRCKVAAIERAAGIT